MTVDLITLAHESETAEAFEAGALGLLAQTLGLDAAFFLVRGREDAVTLLGLDATTRARMAKHGATYAQELLPVKRAALAARGVAVDTEVCGVARVRKTRYYAEVARQVSGQHSLMAYLPWRGGVVAAMMLGRSTKGFSPRDVSLIESLLPTLAVARAAYGLPQVFGPLPKPPAVNPLKQLAFARGFRVLASAQTPGGTLVVRDRAGFREMVASDGRSELVWTRVALDDSTRSGWPYVDLMHLAPALAKQRGRALFIGSGGAVGLRQFSSAYPGIAIDLVEREPAVIDLARAWFELSAIAGVTVHIAEGAAFVRAAAPSTWDVVVIDAYDASTFAAQFADEQFLAALRVALRAGGAVACNVIGTLAGDGPVQRFVSAARTSFDTVRILPVLDLDERYSPDALRNVVVVATRND